MSNPAIVKTMNEDQQKADLLTEMSGAYRQSLSEGSMNLMLRALEDVTAGQLIEAVVFLLKSSRWMPTVADLRSAVGVPDEEPIPYDECPPEAALAADVADWLGEFDSRFDCRRRGATDRQVAKALVALGREGEEVDRSLV